MMIQYFILSLFDIIGMTQNLKNYINIIYNILISIKLIILDNHYLFY